MENDNNDVDDGSNVEQNEVRIGDNPSVVADQYLGEEKLRELIPEEENVFDNDLP